MMQQDTHRVFTVEGKPAYQTIQMIGRGGSARCYLVRKIHEDGALGKYYVIKQFCPRLLEDVLEEKDDRLILRKDKAIYQQEYDELLKMFQEEPEKSQAINHLAGKGSGNYPWVFQEEKISGRPDLLLIDTENGLTVADFVKQQFPKVLSNQYIILCLSIIAKLQESLKGIHRGGMLHLDVKPQNIYIVTQDSRLTPESAFSVKLLDLASAMKKEDLRKETFMSNANWDNATFSDGYSDPLLQRLFNAAEDDMLDKFWAGNVIDERVDWYSTAAVLYFLLTGITDTAFRGGCVSLPRTGVLENSAFRSDLEEVLSRALRGMPYSEEEVKEERFSQDIQRLLFTARVQAAESAKNSQDHTTQKQDTVSTEVPAILESLLQENSLDKKRNGTDTDIHKGIWTFSPEEKAEYEKQVKVLCQKLPDSEDRLNTYTCHSIPHVQEVMQETELLFQAMGPWIQTYIPQNRMEWARIHLILSAKLHDIGMAGTENMRSLLDLTDELYLLADKTCERKSNIREKCGLLLQLAEIENMETDQCRLIGHSMPDGAISPTQLKKTLAGYHDEIQKRIRERHAETSGRYILAHQEELSARYGKNIDTGVIALLAALHSNSSRDSIDPNALNSSLSKEYCGQFIRMFSTEEESKRLCSPGMLTMVFALATLLRLADARRSGSKMCMMDLAPIFVDRTPGGRFILCKDNHGVREKLPFDKSREILLAEACNDFGSVELSGDKMNGWHLVHEMKLKYASEAEIRDLFKNVRIPTYISELTSALLEPTRTVHHEFRVIAPGIDRKTAEGWLRTLVLEPGFRMTVVTEP